MLYVKIFVVAVDHFDGLNSLYQEVKTPCQYLHRKLKIRSCLITFDNGITLSLYGLNLHVAK